MPSIQSTWLKLDAIAHLCPNQDDAGYEQMVVPMSGVVLDVVGADEGLALAGLLERVGDRVANRERERFPIAPTSLPHCRRKTFNSWCRHAACTLEQESYFTLKTNPCILRMTAAAAPTPASIPLPNPRNLPCPS